VNRRATRLGTERPGRGGSTRRLLASVGTLVAGVALAVGALAVGPSRAVAAQSPTPAQAEGDANAIQAQAFLLGTALSPEPIRVGPIAAVEAVVPPGTDDAANTGVVQFDSKGNQPLVDYANVASSNAKATLGTQAATGCAVPSQALTSGFVAGPLTGGNACVAIAQAGLLNSGSAAEPSDQLVAAAVEAQSVTQSCTATPQGFVNIARLALGGTDIIGGEKPAIPLIGTNNPAPNTQIDIPGVATVILNEQHYDSQGHGLTVNAIHIFTATEIGPLVGADIVIGHAHSEANCLTGTTNTGGGPNPGNTTTPVPVVTKQDSTKSADPGETVTYSISVATKGCNVTRVTDFLPPTFIYKSASGSLGTPFATQQQNGNWEVDFYNPTGFTATGGALAETIVVQVPANAAEGVYINNVNGQSAPPAGTTGCGEFQGEDFLPVTNAPPGSPPGTNGNNPGVVVPRPVAAATPTATPTASPTSSTQGLGTTPSIPNTATAAGLGAGAGGSVLLIAGGLLTIAGVSAVARRRRTLD
jgi:uncharacterized repeat protein (TIGR01451 family)